jgi:hypothetical protein
MPLQDNIFTKQKYVQESICHQMEVYGRVWKLVKCSKSQSSLGIERREGIAEV